LEVHDVDTLATRTRRLSVGALQDHRREGRRPVCEMRRTFSLVLEHTLLAGLRRKTCGRKSDVLPIVDSPPPVTKKKKKKKKKEMAALRAGWATFSTTRLNAQRRCRGAASSSSSSSSSSCLLSSRARPVVVHSRTLHLNF